jgi:hypothetical protein
MNDNEEIIGSVLFTVYNDCFSLEYSETLTKEQVIGLLLAGLDQINEEDNTVLH